MWNQERYAWRPGYWAEGRSDWDWIPANYVWTPRGYVFVDGYWDYSFDRRGVVYAPVYFQSDYYSRPGYSYSPVVAIGLAAMMEHLFLRPNYHHYYFGDYYNRRYRDNGYFSPYAYQSSRYGYDPVYSYRRWTHRQDRDWERRYEASYDYRRDHESARPPRTWADQKKLRFDTPESKEQQLRMAAPFDQMAKQKDKPMRTERVAAEERRKLTDQSREVRKTRDERKVLESEGGNIASGRNEREIKPTKVRQPTSPIVGRSPDRFNKKQAPPRPQSSPAADPKRETPARNPDAEKSRPDKNGKPEPRDTGTKNGQQAPRRDAVPTPRKPQPQPERRAENPPPTRQAPKATEPKRETRPEARQPERKALVRPREESKPRETERNREPSKPPTRERSEPGKEASGPSSGKDQKKERR